MPREKTQAERQEEDRIRVGSNALNRLSVVLRDTPTLYAKPVYDLCRHALSLIGQSGENRHAVVHRGLGVIDVFNILPKSSEIVILSETVMMITSISQTDSVVYIEAQDAAIQGLVFDLRTLRKVAA